MSKKDDKGIIIKPGVTGQPQRIDSYISDYVHKSICQEVKEELEKKRNLEQMKQNGELFYVELEDGVAEKVGDSYVLKSKKL